MAAGLGYIEFATGDVLTAATANGYLASQTVMVFASSAARASAITSPQEGMISFLKDTDTMQFYTGAAWSNVDTGASPLTTKGDLYTYSTTNARLGVGANNTVLTADSGEATGLKWASPSGGLTLIKTQTIGSAVSSVSITGIFSSTYDNYLMTVSAGVSSTGTNIGLKMGTTATGYYTAGMYIAYNTTTITGESVQNFSSFFNAFNGCANSLNGQCEIFSPNLAKNTHVLYRNSNSTTTGTYQNYAGYLADTTQYTSATIAPSSGTLTGGTIKVYGYQNS